MKLYYNEHEFLKAISTIQNNPLNTIARLNEYTKKYPYDFCAFAYQAEALINLGRVEEASLILDKTYERLKKYNLEKEKYILFIKQYHMNKLKILIYNEKYEEALYYILFNQDKLLSNEIGSCRFYLSAKTGRIDYLNLNIETYLYKQIANYNEEAFLNHIKKHLSIYNLDTDINNEAIFNEDFPVSKVLEELKKYIPSKKSIFSMYADKYTFKYDFCGRVDAKVSDYFRVITFHNTNELLTMFPINYGSELDYTDLNYLREEKTNIKRLSRIDKFNQRYSAK